MDSHEIAGVVTGLGAALNRHDAGAAGALYAPDACYRELGTGMEVRGREAVESINAEVFHAFPDARFGLGRVVTGPGPGEAVVEWWAEGTHLRPFRGFGPSGRPLRLEAVSVLSVRCGRIAEETVYLNPAPLLAVVLSPGPGEDLLTLTRQYFSAWAAGDAEAVLARFHPDGIREVSGEQPARGVAALRASIRRTMEQWRGWNLKVGRLRGGGGAGSCAAELALTPGSAGRVNDRVQAVCLLTWQGPLLHRETLYLDTTRLGATRLTATAPARRGAGLAAGGDD